jgi:hypothetical protein
MRLARPSAIRDEQVTIPRPDQYLNLQGPLSSRQILRDNVEISRIYGRVYDHLFSPDSFDLPAAHRDARAQVIAADWRALIASKEQHMVREFDQLWKLLT